MNFPNILVWLATSKLFMPHTVAYKITVKYISIISKIIFILTLLVFPFFCLLSWLRILFRKFFKLKPAVIWAPTPILNIADSSKVLKNLGYNSKTLVFTVYYISNQFDYNLQAALKNPAIYPWMPNFLFLWSLLFFDIYHFFYDGGLWSGMKIIPQAKWLELPLLRLAGKRIIASAYGADVRTKRRNEMWQPWNLCRECPEPLKQCICDDFVAARQSKYYRDWCNELLAMGDMHDYVYGSKADFVYWPIDTDKATAAVAKNAVMTIAHSPNHRHFKGTRFVEAAVQALQQKGYAIKLDIIERVSNVEAKQRYAAADIIFAQCIAGWFGYTEIEAMAAAKPLLTYMRDVDRYLAHAPNWPGVSVTPDTLESSIEQLINDENHCQNLGEMGRKYVEDNWSYQACERKYKELHQQIWQNNGLLTTLTQKWRDFFYGEMQYRVGNSSDELKEFPIWSDPNLALDRIAWGLYGRPILNDNGYLQVSLNGNFLQHPGVTALYTLHCYHASLLKPAELSYKENFIKEGRWLANFILNNHADRNEEVDSYSELLKKAIVEIPNYVISYRILALPILLRLKRFDSHHDYEQAIQLIIELTTKTLEEGGFLLLDQNNCFLLDGFSEIKPVYLSSMLLSVFALHEYCLIYENKNIYQLLQQLIASIKKLIKDRSLFDFISVEYIGCDFKMDEYYFLIQSFNVVSKMSNESWFARYAGKLARELYYYRLKNFFKLPL